MDTFQKRLKKCAANVGGYKRLAEKAGVSGMQLKRYEKATSSPTLEKLTAIAHAAGVKLSWLVSGEGSAGIKTSQVVLDKDVFLEVVEQVEKVLMNSGRLLAPEMKSLFIFGTTKAVEQGHEKDKSHILSERIILQMLDYLSATEGLEEAKELFQAIEYLAEETDKSKAKKWADLIVCANTHFYDTTSGKKYFSYLPDITGKYAQSVNYVLQKTENFRAIESILDLGCGNGRYLKYIHEVRPDVTLKGVDTSLKALRDCQYLEEIGSLPPSTFIQADMRSTPLTSSSFDLILARGSLFCFPFHQGGNSPLENVFKEVYRLLKPRGVFHAVTSHGRGLSFYQGHQKMDDSLINALSEEFGFIAMGSKVMDVNKEIIAEHRKKLHENFKDFISFELVKPLKS